MVEGGHVGGVVIRLLSPAQIGRVEAVLLLAAAARWRASLCELLRSAMELAARRGTAVLRFRGPAGAQTVVLAGAVFRGAGMLAAGKAPAEMGILAARRRIGGQSLSADGRGRLRMPVAVPSNRPTPAGSAVPENAKAPAACAQSGAFGVHRPTVAGRGRARPAGRRFTAAWARVSSGCYAFAIRASGAPARKSPGPSGSTTLRSEAIGGAQDRGRAPVSAEREMPDRSTPRAPEIPASGQVEAGIVGVGAGGDHPGSAARAASSRASISDLNALMAGSVGRSERTASRICRYPCLVALR